MFRVHPQRQTNAPAAQTRYSSGAERVPAAVPALAGVVVTLLVSGMLASSAGAVTLPTRSAAVQHRAKPLKTLPAHAAVKQAIEAPNGSRSPYALAAAQRTDSGLPPPGRSNVLRHAAPSPTADQRHE
jgi:hypothetical protein